MITTWPNVTMPALPPEWRMRARRLPGSPGTNPAASASSLAGASCCLAPGRMALKIATTCLGTALALTALVGCLRTPGGIAASTSALEGRPYEVLGQAFGAVTQYHVLGIIPTGQAVQLQAAVEDAKRKAGADALIDVTAELYRKDYVIYSATTTEVRGKAIRFLSR